MLYTISLFQVRKSCWAVFYDDGEAPIYPLTNSCYSFGFKTIEHWFLVSKLLLPQYIYHHCHLKPPPPTVLLSAILLRSPTQVIPIFFSLKQKELTVLEIPPFSGSGVHSVFCKCKL